MKTRTVLILIAAVCGGLFLAGAACCTGMFFFAYRDLDDTLSPTIDELFARIDDGSFADTYETHTTSEFQRNTTREQYTDLGNSVRTRLGSLRSKRLQGFNVHQLNADRYADVVYGGTFEDGTGTIRGRFEKKGDRWLIVALQVTSPEFQKDLTTGRCPHCGEPHTSDAKFCPGCGEPLTGDEPATQADDQ